VSIQEEYKIYCVRSGQPRPYADTEYAYVVERTEYDWQGEAKFAWPTVYGEKMKPDEELSREKMFEIAKMLLGIKDFRYSSEVNHSSMDDHFRGWNTMTYLGEGRIEISTIHPFCD